MSTRREKFKLPDGSFFVSDIQDYLENIKHETVTDYLPIGIYINEIENRIKFKIKKGYYLHLLMPETIKLLRSTKNKLTKDEKGENVPHLEIAEVVLVHRNNDNNNYQRDSRVLYTFIPDK